jgi:uncharacterized protein with GYD domain
MKNKRLSVGAGVVLLLTICSCTPYFQAANFDTLTADHTRIAVLPFDMIFTGQMPEELTEADLLRIEEAESQAFQISFYNQLLRSTRRGKKNLRVEVQHYQATNKSLKEHGISVRESWSLSPEELADILEVDAVVRANIEKARFMSDLASFGIELGVDLINVLTNYQLWPWLPPVSTQNKAVVADFSLFEENEGTVLWSISFDKGADWREPANQIINQITRRAAKKFPYRR